MEDIRKVFLTLALKADFSIGLLDHKHILIRLNNEDFQRLWLRDQWFIKKYTLRVFKWSPDFIADVESSRATVWICFPYLPIHFFFSKASLLSIASAIGVPLKLDAATVGLSRPNLARVCGDEKGFWQSVEFESIPKYCLLCFKKGHDDKSCKKNKPHTENLMQEFDHGVAQDARNCYNGKGKITNSRQVEGLVYQTEAGERFVNPLWQPRIGQSLQAND
ncbi:DUF4283 domain-containing protein/zf-CCHC_4 domain-containing protein [Cephalotus follicularis]|uniref:DUF4283 domain-containing protein/zf-CCHC_4 domain-containing protein n=1 Tax=Cephalotus follicularis TaxID=3775 RepID=A0A1Q3C7I0_CEPFO|nr:DUF4283 domain-containing protein/zf-CCHC_4 domain-containing protein [Cephalotus follicularis]